MILDQPRKYGNYEINGFPGNFSATPNGINAGTHTFHTVFEPYKNSRGTMVTLQSPCEANLFADLDSLCLMVDVTSRQDKISSMDNVTAWDLLDVDILILYEPLMLSLPSNNNQISVDFTLSSTHQQILRHKARTTL